MPTDNPTCDEATELTQRIMAQRFEEDLRAGQKWLRGQRIIIIEDGICTTCQKRALRRLQNATNPWRGRMGHGGEGGFNAN